MEPNVHQPPVENNLDGLNLVAPSANRDLLFALYTQPTKHIAFEYLHRVATPYCHLRTWIIWAQRFVPSKIHYPAVYVWVHKAFYQVAFVCYT